MSYPLIRVFCGSAVLGSALFFSCLATGCQLEGSTEDGFTAVPDTQRDVPIDVHDPSVVTSPTWGAGGQAGEQEE